MRTWVELGPSLDARSWGARHAAGEVPDAAPYGLDRLQDHGLATVFRPAPGRVGATAARPVRKVTGMQWSEAVLQPPPMRAELCLSWDERAGVPRAALSAGRLPVVTGVIWLDEPGTYRWGSAAARALKRCALVWTLSSAQVPVLLELGVPASRLEHLRFGVDTDFFGARGVEEVEPDLLVSVGNDRHRDWPTLITAFTDLRRHRPEARLEVVTAADLPVVAGMTIRPRLRHDELRELYARAAAVVLTTRPNRHVSGMTAALEAQASGRPVILSGTAGSEDYVTDGASGHLVTPGDADALVRRLLEVLDGGTALVAQMGSTGRREVETGHSSALQAARLTALIQHRC